MLAYLSFYGINIWFGLQDDINYLYQDPYNSSVFVREHILIPMLYYQLVNVVVSLFINKFRDIPSLAHHIVAAGVAFCTLGPCWNYYAVFFLDAAKCRLFSSLLWMYS